MSVPLNKLTGDRASGFGQFARQPEAASDTLDETRTESLLELQTVALQAAADGVIITDASGRIIWSNPAFAAMTGYSAEETNGRAPGFLKSGRQSPAFYCHLWETILSGQVWSGEVVNRRKDGSLYVEEQTITPVMDKRGSVRHFIAVKHDITQRRMAEDELRRRHHELTVLNLLGSALNSSLVLPDAVATCRGLLSSMLEGAGGAIYLYDSASGKLRPETAWGQCEVEWRKGHVAASSARLNRARGERAVLVENDRICVPLLAQGRLKGLLVVLHPLGQGHPLFDTLFYEALGRELGTAIQNALLFEEVCAGRERAQALARRVVEAQEAERRHISRELHDEAAQVLMGMKLGLKLLERESARSAAALAQLADLRAMADDALATLRRLATDLRPASLEHLGLRQAIEQYAESIAEKNGLDVDFEATGSGERMPANVENALYRITQEALANVVRHARASRVDIVLEQGERRVVLMIEDDGVGMRLAEVMKPASGHLGLIGIRERVEMLGGTMRIESAPGAGTMLVVEAPRSRQ